MTAVALLHFAQVGCQVAVLRSALAAVWTPPTSSRPPTLPLSRASASTIPICSATPSARSLLKRLASSSREAPWFRGRRSPRRPKPWKRRRTRQAARFRSLISANWTLRLSAILTPKQIEPGKPSVVRPFTYKGDAYETTLLGGYQPQNAALALETVFALQCRGWDIPQSAVERGVAATRWAGRFEVLPHVPGKPTVVIDGGHNPQGAQALADSLADVFAGRKADAVLGRHGRQGPSRHAAHGVAACCRVRSRDSRQSPERCLPQNTPQKPSE